MNLSLYEVLNTYASALNDLLDADLPQDVIDDTLDGLSGMVEIKANNVMMFVKNVEALADSIKKEEQLMYSRRKNLENRAERFKQYILDCMKSSGINRISCPNFELFVKQNPESVEIFSAEMIPHEYMRVKDAPPPEPDKNKIKNDLKSGVDIPGVKLLRKTTLGIK